VTAPDAYFNCVNHKQNSRSSQEKCQRPPDKKKRRVEYARRLQWEGEEYRSQA